MNTTTEYKTDTRWHKGWAPEDTNAAYGGRWISTGAGTVGDVVWDRHGFAYNDTAYRDSLMAALNALQLHRPMPFKDYVVEGNAQYAECDVTCGTVCPEGGLTSEGVCVSWGVAWRMEIPHLGDYVYVEVWRLP